MRDGDLNCVARRVIKHFKASKRGQGLTPARRQKITKWEALVHNGGATLQYIAGLEKILKRVIVVHDITGADLYNSWKYQHSGWKLIELTLHNGHAWGKNLQFPQAREVVIYEGDVWEAIREATQGEPNAVWVLGGGQDKRLTVDQFVLDDGRTYRTAQTHDALLKACPALAPEDPEALAQKVFGENHAASVVTKERNNWKPTPVNLLEVAQAGCVEHGHEGALECSKLPHQCRGVNRHALLLPRELHGKRRGCALVPALWPTPPPHDPRRCWWLNARQHRHQLHTAPSLAVRQGPPPSYRGLVRLPLPGEEVDADGPARLYGRDWPPDQTRDHWGHRRLWETDRGLAPRFEGPGMLCHRQVHTGCQGRRQEAHPQAHHRPGRTGLPRPRHVPVRYPSRRPCKMFSWLDSHLLRRLPAAVRPPQGLDAGLSSY